MPSRPSPRRRPRGADLPRPRRGGAAGCRRAASRLLILLLPGLVACTGARPAPAPPPAAQPLALPEHGEHYLLDPLVGTPQAFGVETFARLREAHTRLLAEGAVAAAGAAAEELLAADPGLAPARVLLAQVEFARGRWRDAAANLEPLTRVYPAYPAAQVLLGRSLELLGDVPAAYAAYRAVAAASRLAFERTGALHSRALEVTANRVGEAVRIGDLDAARRQLALLREWGPSEEMTFEAARAVAAAEGDPRAELAAVQPLSDRRPDDRALLERRAELEFEVGDPGKGLEIVQRLAERHPADPALAGKLEQAKFRWRVALLPPGVQALVDKPELTRSELAVLFYWLIPSVRHARPAAGRIATDVLEHPHQEELVRAVNLGLLDVDQRLHRVFPDGEARRGTALRALNRLLRMVQKALPCLAAGEADAGAETSCAAAARCGLVGGEEDCRSQDPLSGPEALELVRRALDLVGAE